jgi:hypothetical protein
MYVFLKYLPIGNLHVSVPLLILSIIISDCYIEAGPAYAGVSKNVAGSWGPGSLMQLLASKLVPMGGHFFEAPCTVGDFKVGVSVGVYCTKCTPVLTPTLKSPNVL